MSFKSVSFALIWLAPSAFAHIALWHPSMYGWDDNPNQNDACNPLRGMNMSDWWFHGWIDSPPAAGEIMELPAGGTFHGEVSCNKGVTKTWGHAPENEGQEFACGNGVGSLHTSDTLGEVPPVDVMGCGIGIAYESDPHKIQPQDFTVISVNYTCPWRQAVDFQIPSDLPPCPPGGCTCMWGWVHSPDSGGEQMYMLGYRCNVTGATGTQPLPQAQIARKCPVDRSNCTVGSKQPHYWLELEGNNNYQDSFDPPFYNQYYGFQDGAQTDLFDAVSTTPTYTQTSWAANFFPDLYGLGFKTQGAQPVTSATASVTNSQTPVSSPSVTSNPSPVSAPSQSVPTPLSSSTPNTLPAANPTYTAAASTNTLSTQMGSPTFQAPPVNVNAAESTSSVVPQGSCKKTLSSRAEERMADPNVRRSHKARAERRRMRKSVATRANMASMESMAKVAKRGSAGTGNIRRVPRR